VVNTVKTPIVPGTAQKAGSESHLRGRFQAPFALRCGAMLIDYVLLALVLTLSVMIARLLGGGARMAGGTAERVGLILTAAFILIDWGLLAGISGQTLGKWATGLRIEKLNGRPPGIGRAVLRHFIGYPLSLLPLGLGFLVVVFNGSGRSLHDLISGTIVVREYSRAALHRRAAVVRDVK
jgi:uncharacterized RDD family membrane protein YckC